MGFLSISLIYIYLIQSDPIFSFLWVFFLAVKGEGERGVLGEKSEGLRFMSARFGLGIEKSGAFLKLCLISVSSAVLLLAIFKQQSLCCTHQQGASLRFPTASMRLRPKR